MANIRKAEAKDINQLTDLMYEYIVDFYQRPKPPVEKIHQIFYTLLNQKEGIQFIAEQDGKLVGFTTLYFTYSTLKANKVTVLNDLYVIEKLRGTNVAKELFRKAQNFTTENDFAYMSWVTAIDNKRAQRFYEKMGATSGEWLNYSI